jgi:hypothetical protein
MIVPQYWAEARLHRAGRKQVTVRRFGWSDVSQEAAQAHADERARDAFERVLAGEPLRRREPKEPYDVEGLPIREEIVERHGESIVTRNSYGALCLNTPDVMFTDIDFQDPGPDRRLRRQVRWPLLACAVLLGWWSGSWLLGICLVAMALYVAYRISLVVHRRRWMKDGGPERRAHQRIDAFVEANPTWRLRVYRTPAGLRLLTLHRTFAPDDPEVVRCFQALQADDVYVLMCVRQHCFRARVSAKPWRIGVHAHMRPRPGVWPVRPEYLPGRQRWVAEYEAVARGYAACRYLHELGEGTVDAAAARVRDLHDNLCQAERALPLA